MPRLTTSTAAGLALALALGCDRGSPRSTPSHRDAPSRAPTAEGADEGVAIDLLRAWREGGIDSDGPVIDLGEPQGRTWLVGSSALPTTTLNGDSWAAVAQRVRFRLPLLPDGADDPAGRPRALPTALRVRVRHCTARYVAVVIDGLLARTAALPANGAVGVVTVPITPERLTRDVAEVELRFGVARVKPGLRGPVAAEVDWAQLTRGPAPAVRAADLLHDVALERTPRRALTFFAPTVLSTVQVLPEGARFRASLGAEAPRGAARAPPPAVARIRFETDGEPAIERRVTLVPNAPWQDVSVPLEAWGGRTVRLSITALEGVGEARIAVSAPRVERAVEARAAPRSAIRHAVVVVLRGARADRFFPTLSPRLTASGFARLAREGVRAEAVAASGREWASLVSAVTGIPADLHRMTLATDYLDDAAPTLASRLAELGVSTRLWTDDSALLGSGADRGFASREGCPRAATQCRAEAVITAASDALPRPQAGRSLTVVVTRAGVLPLDPAPEAVTALDPQPYEGTMTPMQTGSLSARARHGEVRIEGADAERLGLLYDAVLVGVDQALARLLDRLQEGGAADTLVLVVGDRGTALGDSRTVGDGPASLRAVGSTVLYARGPGLPAGRRLAGVVGVLDVAATVLDAFGGELPEAFDGRSLLDAHGLTARSLVLVANARGELGLRFGQLLAIPRPALLGGGLALIAPEDDPAGLGDLSPQRPIARIFAEGILASVRGSDSRRAYTPSTRALP